MLMLKTGPKMSQNRPESYCAHADLLTYDRVQAFEAYCTKQAASSMLLATMEREKELLRVFLKVISLLLMGFDIFCLVPEPEFLLFRQGLNLRAIFSGVSDGEQDPP